MDNLTINGQLETFSTNPNWDARDNRRTYTTTNVRPRFDFGYAATNKAGGQSPGEMGGIVFRGDNRFPSTLAYYGDRTDKMTLDNPLKASGKIALTRGVSDSTMLFGFFNSQASIEVNNSQSSGLPKDFIGIAVDGPSREGFLLFGGYRVHGDGQGYGFDNPVYIYPNGDSHDFTFEYDPLAAGGRGRITASLDGQLIHLDLGAGLKQIGAEFDRFGLVTSWVDGNAQHIYFDDLTYTVGLPEPSALAGGTLLMGALLARRPRRAMSL